ncbi:outer membrane protein assembly factor BamE [Orbus sturtevantii]|uniref:outer membrane protein assembly factor BamE n=1 Tax=Orbus sturtevantii TaxID=3074109 RepID=UPI00370DDA3A
MFSYRSITILVITMLLLSGCSFVNRWVYRPDINQGNYITQSEIDKLKVGQTKEQVVYIMGNPMLSSVFTDNVWYYIFRELPEHGYVSQKTYTVIFDQRGKVTDVKISSFGKETLQQMDNEPETD